jgi:RND family efflux transporter MFP subunit
VRPAERPGGPRELDEHMKIRQSARPAARRRRILGWLVLAVIVLGAAGFAYYRFAYQPTQAARSPALETAVVRRGDLILSASGTGTLIPQNEISPAFGTSGTVTEVDVAVGDAVQQGDLLAKVDDADAKLQLAQAQRSLSDLTTPAAITTAQSDEATAQVTLDQAIGHLSYLLSPDVFYWENQIEKTQQALEAAKATAAASPTDKQAQADLQTAQAAVEHAQAGLVGAKANYPEYVKKYFTYMIKNPYTKRLEKYVDPPTDADIQGARAAVSAAQAAVAEATDYYTALTGGQVPADATGANLAALQQAQLDVQSAQDGLSSTELHAAISGTVLSVDVNVGDHVNSNTSVMTIADLSQPYLEVYMDETDAGYVKAGADANVTFDILPNQTYPAKVAQVDPGLYTESSSAVVRAYVDLSNVDATEFDLPLSSSATVEVIGSQARNAILVPVQALHQSAGGQYTVSVLVNGQPETRSVQIGIQDLINAEVKSGLQPGDVVVTGSTSTP